MESDTRCPRRDTTFLRRHAGFSLVSPAKPAPCYDTGAGVQRFLHWAPGLRRGDRGISHILWVAFAGVTGYRLASNFSDNAGPRPGTLHGQTWMQIPQPKVLTK